MSVITGTQFRVVRHRTGTCSGELIVENDVGGRMWIPIRDVKHIPPLDIIKFKKQNA